MLNNEKEVQNGASSSRLKWVLHSKFFFFNTAKKFG